MKRGQIYESEWLKAGDMLEAGQDAGIDVTVARIATHELDDGRQQRVLSFRETEKKLGLNATNWDAIAAITGDDDDDLWIGKRINVYPQKLDRPFMGKSHGVRVRACSHHSSVAAPRLQPVTAVELEASRKAAFEMMRRLGPPGATQEELKKAWMDSIASMFPGRRQIELTAADWDRLRGSFEYRGEPAAPKVIADDDIPF